MMGYGYGPGVGYGEMMGGGVFGLFLMLAFWTLVVVGIVLLVRWLSHGHGPMGPGHHMGMPMTPPTTGAASHDEAVAIAKRRLASGEITPTEYEEIMRVLNA